MKHIKNIFISSISILSMGLGVLLGVNNNRSVSTKAEDKSSSNVIYLDASYTYRFSGYVAVTLYDDSNSTILDMKKIPDNNNWYRVTIPSDVTYKYARFFAQEDKEHDLLKAYTPIDVEVPKGKNIYVIDSLEYDTQYVAMCRGYWDKYDGDTPTSGDGYYLVGSKTNWKFKNAPKLVSGTHGDKVELINYSASAKEEFYIRSYIEDEDTTYGEKYVVGDSDVSINIFLDNEDNFVVDPYVLPPEREGYYINGVFSNVEVSGYDFKYRMSDVTSSHIAELRNLECKLGDKLTVKSFYFDRHPYEIYANISTDQDVSSYGHIEDNYFIFDASGYYDVFVNSDDENIEFIILPHVEAYTVDLTVCYYDGITKTDISFIASQTAYAGEEFYPEVPSIDNYVFAAVYKDSDCLYKYESSVLEANCDLYLRYVSVNYYAFTGPNVHGSYDPQYIYDTGIKMNTSNLPEEYTADIYLEVTEKNSYYQFGWLTPQGSIFVNSGGDYLCDYVVYDYEGKTYNFIFKEKGTYHICWKSANNHVNIFDAGGEPFVNKYISSIEIDENNHVVTPLETLKSNWSKQKDLFNSIENKQGFYNVGFKYTDEPSNIYEKFINKFYLAVYRYGSLELENYIFPNIEVDPHPYSYEITLNPNGGKVEPTVISAIEGEEVILPKASKSGYIFLGWQVNGEGEYITSITVNGDVTLVAAYKVAPKGCGGDITATSIILSSLALIGVGVLIIRRKKEQ